jgi:hypothetical protein
MSDKRMGRMFDQGAYPLSGQGAGVPLPRSDPRLEADQRRFLLRLFDEDAAEPVPGMARAAGIESIDPRRPFPRPGARTRQPEPSPEISREQGFLAGQGMSRMINPGRFSDALTRMPLSTAPVIYEPSFHEDPLGRFPAATFDERFKGM